MMIGPLTTGFVASLLSEIADRTQLVILGFALEYKAPWKVFLGALSGHALMDGLAVIIGFYFGSLFLSRWIDLAVGILFIILGLWIIAKPHIRQKKKRASRIKSSAPFIVTFVSVFVMEFGDKTQVASGLLAAKFSENYAGPLLVFIGATLGLALTIGLNVFVGSRLAEKLPKKAINLATAVVFILFGVLTLFYD